MLCNIGERDAYLVNTLHTAEEAGVVAALSSSHLNLAQPDVQLFGSGQAKFHFDNTSFS